MERFFVSLALVLVSIGCRSDVPPAGDGLSAFEGLTIEVNPAVTTEPFRDLCGTNKDPDFLRKRDRGDRFDVSSLYQFLGISQVRLHDGDLDLCDIYKDATLLDLQDGAGGELSECRGDGDPSDHHRWNVNEPNGAQLISNYDFSAADASVAAVVKAQAAVYLRLGESFQGPNDTATPEAWAEVAGNIVAHYSGSFGTPVEGVKLAGVEVGNEPGGSFWVGPDAAFYDLYEKTATQVGSVPAGVQIGGPGFRHQAVDEFSMPETLAAGFLEKVPASATDFVSAHYYAGCKDSTLKAAAEWLDGLRSAVDASGRAATPLHITEWNVGLAQDCPKGVFVGTRAQSFAASWLTLLQDPSLNVQAAHQYAGIGTTITLTELESDSSTTILLHPTAWAIWAHAQLADGNKVETQLCQNGACMSSLEHARSGGEVVAVSTVRDNTTRVLLVNYGADSETVRLSVAGHTTATQLKPPSGEASKVATEQVDGIYSPTAAALEALENNITEQALSSVAPGVWDLDLAGYGFMLVRLDP